MPYVNIVSASLMTILLSMTYVTAAATVSSRTLDAVSDTTIPLPAGKYATLRLLGSAVNGKQPHQNFVVTYTDGTTNTITQSLSDWWGPPQNYTGESQVLKMPYLVTSTGATMNQVVYVYGYSFAINSAKTVKSLTLPHNRNVRVLAIDVSARGATPVRVNLAAVDNVGGIVNNGTAPIDGGWDNCCHAYSATLLGTSNTSGGLHVHAGRARVNSSAGCAGAADFGLAGDNGGGWTVLQFQSNRRGTGRLYVELHGGA